MADLEVCSGELHGATFGGEPIVTMIDELPILAVAATQAHGRTVVRDADELRVKETDRIATTVSELRKMGAKIEPTADGFIIDGPTPADRRPRRGPRRPPPGDGDGGGRPRRPEARRSSTVAK